MTPPPAEVIAVGTELMLHGRLDTNSPWLGSWLAELGFRPARGLIVGDDRQALAEALREAAGRAPLVVITGGLGPTADDVTREAVARAFGRRLRTDPKLVEELEARFGDLGRAMPRSNLRQALVPDGGEPLPNPRGSAPGLWLDHPGGVVLALPGPPAEMRAVLSDRVRERLRLRFRPPATARRSLQICGLAESALEDRIADLYPGEEGLQVTVLARPGLVEVLVLAADADPERAEAAAGDLAARLRERLGDKVFGEGGASLAQRLGERLRGAGYKLAVAESCTGGLLGAELTEAPGASGYFLGGLLAYENRIKEEQAGVPAATLARHGAVSEETARALAEGVRGRFGADFGLAVTGIAGPGGGTPDKPVGLVWFAVAGPGGTATRRRRMRGGRDQIRRWAVATALHLLRDALDELEGRR